MGIQQRTWAVVLAAGDGTRLASLTTDERGNSVPKQFCSLNGGSSLLQDALARAREIAARGRRCVIVSAQHEKYWRPSLWALPRGNVIVQPRNCGTANGILLAVLSILARDPQARIVFLPADHHVRDESLLSAALRQVVTQLTRSPRELVLLGMQPEAADPELGYVVPGARAANGVYCVDRFVEKPATTQARELIAQGAVWNSFIFAAHGPELLKLLFAHMSAVVNDMRTALALDARRGVGPLALNELYDELPSVDFSKAIVQGATPQLRLITAAACGWSDLGTPARVTEALKRLAPSARRDSMTQATVAGFINLAFQAAQLSLSA